MTFTLGGIPGGYELWVILLILLLLFGRRIPQVARSLGQGISQFKKGLSEPDADLEDPDEKKSDGKKSDGKKSDGKKSDGKKLDEGSKAEEKAEDS